MYKYVAASGLGDYIMVSNNLTKLQKAARDYAKSDFESYIECCEYLEESPELTKEDFQFVGHIEKGTENVDFAIMMAERYGDNIYEI